MNRFSYRYFAAGLCALMAAIGQTHAQSEQLRISEVDPITRQVEVSNLGAGFTTSSELPFCHRFDYRSSIPEGTVFADGGRTLFTVNNLATTSDLWLYSSRPFAVGENILTGLQYGATDVGRTELASNFDLWNGAASAAPTPPAGSTLAWDGDGFTSFDWYIDETPTLGSADSTTPETIASVLAYPAATQTFEALPLGDEIIAIENWPVVDTAPPGQFTVRSVDDVLGVRGPRGTSSRWLRIHDHDATDNQNRFYGPFIDAPATSNYRWSFWVNVERLPPADPSDSKPRFTIQHRTDNGGIVNTWGIEYDATGAYLIVTDQGGDEAQVALFDLTDAATSIGEWVEIVLDIDFDAAMVSAAFNDQAPVSLPIAPDMAVDDASFRFCYRGEGTGNVGTFLLDDVSVQVDDPDLIFSDGFES